MNVRAEIAPFVTGNNDPFFQLDLSADVALPVSFSIIDLLSSDGGPGERMGGGTQTLAFPGTKSNNKAFQFIFEINATGGYNANKQAQLRVYVDELIQFNGVCKLDTIDVSYEGAITYNCTGSSGFSNLLAAWNNNGVDLLIQDLGWDDLDMFLSDANIEASWTATPGAVALGGNGYVFPMIDFGENDLHAWYVTEFYPAVYVMEIIVRAFEVAGFTISSNFLTNTGDQVFDFSHLIIPFNGGILKFTPAEIATRQFYASYIGSNISLSATPLTIPFNDTSTAPDYDPSGQWSNSSHKWTIPSGKGGEYTIQANINVTVSALTQIFIGISINGSPLNAFQSFQYGIATNTIIPFSFTGSFNDGDTVAIIIESDGTSGAHLTQGSAPNQTSIYNIVINNGITEGYLWPFSSGVPQNIKVSDFFKSIVSMFNLYVDVDPQNPYNLIIEPRDAFYASGEAIDWTQKWDTSQKANITPIGRHLSKNYLFTFSSDSDYYNTLYSQRYYFLDHNQIYGEMEEITDNDYLTDTNKTDILFAPTPLSFYKQIGTGPVNDKILSTIHFGGNSNNAQDGTNTSQYQPTQKPNGSVPRILYYGGLKPCATWYIRSVFGSQPNLIAQNSGYPYAGHLDDPINPSIDLNFGAPNTLFYQFLVQNYTNQNLYNTFYQTFIDEITDQDSKVVTLYVKLTPLDILQLEFRNIILIDKTYYKLLEITDYDMSTYKTSQVVLLKSTEQPRIQIVNTPLPSQPQRDSQAALIGGGSVRAMGGSGNIISIDASNIIVTGNNNTVLGNSQGIAIHGGSGNIVSGSNLTVINCTNQTINDNDAVYINNVKYPPPVSIDSADVIAALGYTPYSSANPAGYISTIGPPVVVASFSQTGANATINQPTFYTAISAGMYRFDGYLVDTVASTSGGVVTVSLAWTDSSGAQTNSSAAVIALSSLEAKAVINQTIELMTGAIASFVATVSGIIVGSPTYTIRMTLTRLQ